MSRLEQASLQKKQKEDAERTSLEEKIRMFAKGKQKALACTFVKEHWALKALMVA